MNARKYAGGTRRPRRSPTRSPKIKRRSGGSAKNKGCALILFALASLPAVLVWVTR